MRQAVTALIMIMLLTIIIAAGCTSPSQPKASEGQQQTTAGQTQGQNQATTAVSVNVQNETTDDGMDDAATEIDQAY